jgi:hypothetical protein
MRRSGSGPVKCYMKHVNARRIQRRSLRGTQKSTRGYSTLFFSDGVKTGTCATTMCKCNSRYLITAITQSSCCEPGLFFFLEAPVVAPDAIVMGYCHRFLLSLMTQTLGYCLFSKHRDTCLTPKSVGGAETILPNSNLA